MSAVDDGNDLPGQIGVVRGFHVADNGQGAASPPDQLAFVPAIPSIFTPGITTSQEWCDDMPPRNLFDIERGDIMVR